MIAQLSHSELDVKHKKSSNKKKVKMKGNLERISGELKKRIAF